MPMWSSSKMTMSPALPLLNGARIRGERCGVARKINGEIWHAAIVDVFVRRHTEITFRRSAFVIIYKRRQIKSCRAHAISDNICADAGAVCRPAANEIRALVARTCGDIIQRALENILLIGNAVTVSVGCSSDGEDVSAITVRWSAVFVVGEIILARSKLRRRAAQ